MTGGAAAAPIVGSVMMASGVGGMVNTVQQNKNDAKKDFSVKRWGCGVGIGAVGGAIAGGTSVVGAGVAGVAGLTGAAHVGK